MGKDCHGNLSFDGELGSGGYYISCDKTGTKCFAHMGYYDDSAVCTIDELMEFCEELRYVIIPAILEATGRRQQLDSLSECDLATHGA